MKEYVNDLNYSLQELEKNAKILQGQINTQNDIIGKIIESNKTQINGFLESAGFDYRVDFNEDREKYNLILKHKDQDKMLNEVKNHLSYGERNAFALVLFMYHSTDLNADLIILDDPISSFDFNKKFAILNMLFFSPDSKFKNKTTLLLTHDFTSIIDVIHKGLQPTPSFYFLSNDDGHLSEEEIKKGDILTFNEICINNAKQVDNIISGVIYLRRYYEVFNRNGLEWNFLSSIIHKRERPSWDTNGEEPMSDEDFEKATMSVREYISEFDYDDAIKKVKDPAYLLEQYNSTTSNYEKLQMYRLINEENSSNTVVRNFINNTYHVENDLIYQLNPNKYQTIPKYVIELCDNELKSKPGFE